MRITGWLSSAMNLRRIETMDWRFCKNEVSTNSSRSFSIHISENNTKTDKPAEFHQFFWKDQKLLLITGFLEDQRQEEDNFIDSKWLANDELDANVRSNTNSVVLKIPRFLAVHWTSESYETHCCFKPFVGSMNRLDTRLWSLFLSSISINIAPTISTAIKAPAHDRYR